MAESFAASAHRTVLEALVEAGHEFTDVDLYAEHFDPVMSRQERLDYLNTDRNERPVQRYDDSWLCGHCARRLSRDLVRALRHGPHQGAGVAAVPATHPSGYAEASRSLRGRAIQ